MKFFKEWPSMHEFLRCAIAFLFLLPENSNQFVIKVPWSSNAVTKRYDFVCAAMTIVKGTVFCFVLFLMVVFIEEEITCFFW